MLAKIKEAKKIRATLAVQNELSDLDNVCHIVVTVMCGLVMLFHLTSIFTLVSADNARCACSNK